MKFCTLASGSNGNCCVISSGDKHILVDIGISNRAVCTALCDIGVSPNDVAAILITHEHYDHIKGLEVWMKKHPDCVIFASAMTADYLREHLPCEVTEITAGEQMCIAEFNVRALKTSHDTPESLAYLIEKDGVFAMIATDTGFVSDELRENMCGVDLLLIESNYDEKMLRYGAYPAYLKARIAGERGHLSNDECAESVLYAVKNGCRCVMLGHLSQENNSPKIAYDTTCRKLLDAGIIPGVDMQLGVAPRGKRGEPIEVIKEELCSEYQ